MRRGLAGLLFFIAAVGLALAAGGWYLQRVAFDTAHSGDLARVVLRDDAIRAQIATAAGAATAQTLGVAPEQIQAQVDTLARSDAGADLMRQIITDAHAKLIGERTAPVEITGPQLVQLTRNEAVGALPPVVLPVEEVGVLSTIREALRWAVPIAAVVGALALLLGLVAHPHTADAVFGIGTFCIVAGVFAIGLGFLVPVYLLPAITDNVWVSAIPEIARYALPVVVVVAIVLVAGGIALMIGRPRPAAARRGRRRCRSATAISTVGRERYRVTSSANSSKTSA